MEGEIWEQVRSTINGLIFIFLRAVTDKQGAREAVGAAGASIG
jgi:hypothetical protein